MNREKRTMVCPVCGQVIELPKVEEHNSTESPESENEVDEQVTELKSDLPHKYVPHPDD